MKFTPSLLFLCMLLSLNGHGQFYAFSLLNSSYEPISGATLTINGKPSVEGEKGFYKVENLTFDGSPFSKMKVQASHPHYETMDDSLFVSQTIVMGKTSETDYFLSGGRKIPCIYYPTVSSVYLGDATTRSTFNAALQATNGRIIQENDPCGSWKGSDWNQGTIATIAHDRLDLAIEFRKATRAFSAISFGQPNNFHGIRPQVYITQVQYKPLDRDLTAILEEWKNMGYLSDIWPNPGSTVGYSITFSDEYAHEAHNFLKILEEKFPAMIISQEMLSVICLD